MTSTSKRSVTSPLLVLSELFGDDEHEQTQSDMIVSCMEDFSKPLMTIYAAKDEEKVSLRSKTIIMYRISATQRRYSLKFDLLLL